jgi:dienelactone hydrolase
MFSPKVSRRRPAVLVIGGSGGGLATALSYTAAGLAEAGYPALAVGYFKLPGLPFDLETISLEYFATALHWLARQPGVDSRRLVTWGVSRGSEAALLLGVNYPELVRGVAALVPSNVTLCASPTCPQPAWTLNGTAVPFQTVYGPAVASTDAAIPVERIAGTILLVCGGADATWPSCPMADAIVARLSQHHAPFPHVLLKYPSAGHEIGYLRPASPRVSHGPPSPYSNTPAGSHKARKQAWARALRFLAKTPKDR